MTVGVGLQLKAADIMNLSFFPVGMVLPISGEVTDATGGVNVKLADGSYQFLKGWRICNKQYGTPDMRNRYITGVGADLACGDGGGASSVALTEANLPPHSHMVTITNVGYGGEHHHTIDFEQVDDYNFTAVSRPGALTSSPTTVGSSAGSGIWNNSSMYISYADIPAHGHTISGEIGYTGSSQNQLALQPAFYSLIFIKKMT